MMSKYSLFLDWIIRFLMAKMKISLMDFAECFAVCAAAVENSMNVLMIACIYI